LRVDLVINITRATFTCYRHSVIVESSKKSYVESGNFNCMLSGSSSVKKNSRGMTCAYSGIRSGGTRNILKGGQMKASGNGSSPVRARGFYAPPPVWGRMSDSLMAYFLSFRMEHFTRRDESGRWLKLRPFRYQCSLGAPP